MAAYSAYTDLKIGSSVPGLTAVTALTYSGAAANCPPPRTQFQEAAEIAGVANGNLKLLGRPVIAWEWPTGLPVSARRALRAFIASGMSGTVYIQSPDENGDIQIYQAVMQWPHEPASYQAFDITAPLSIRFVQCIEQSP